MRSKKRKLPAESTVAVSNARRGWYRIFPVTLGKKWDPAVAETSLAAGDTLVLLEILIPGEDRNCRGFVMSFPFLYKRSLI